MDKTGMVRSKDYFIFWELIEENLNDKLALCLDLIKKLIVQEGKNAKTPKPGVQKKIQSHLATLSALSVQPHQTALPIGVAEQLRHAEDTWFSHDQKQVSEKHRNLHASNLVLCFFDGYKENIDRKYCLAIDVLLALLIKLPFEVNKHLSQFVVIKGTQSEVEKDHQYDSNSNYKRIDMSEAMNKKLQQVMTEYQTKTQQTNLNQHQFQQNNVETQLNTNYEVLSESPELSYIYEHFVALLHSSKKNTKNIQDAIVEYIIFYLKLLPIIYMHFIEMAEKSALCLLHLVKQVVIFHPLLTIDESAFRQLIFSVDIFKRWPFPISHMAREITYILAKEMKTVGTHFRLSVRESIPSFDFLYYLKSEDTLALHQAYLVTESEQNVNLMEIIVNHNQFKLEKKEIITDVHKLRHLMVIQIFQTQKLVDEKFISHLAGLNDRDLFLIANHLFNVLDKCNDQQCTPEMKQQKDRALDDIQEEVLQMSSNHSPLKTEILSIIKEQHIANPLFPTCQIKLVKRQEYTNQNNKNFNTNTSMQELRQYTNQNDSNLLRYSEIFQQIIEEIKQVKKPQHQETFKLIVYGDDKELQILVQEMGTLFKKSNELFRSVCLQLYLLPKQGNGNSLARVLAVKDIWYQQHTYFPFTENLLIPRRNEQDSSDLYQQGLYMDKKCLPFETLETSIQTYLREATRCLEVKCYEIKCYNTVLNHLSQNLKQISTIQVIASFNYYNFIIFIYLIYKFIINQQNAVEEIYFCQYIEFQTYQKSDKNLKKGQKKSKNTSKQDETTPSSNNNLNNNNNNPDHRQLSLILHTQSVTPLGETQKVEQQHIKCNSLKINNVYKQGFEGNLPYPSSDWLEMAYLEEEEFQTQAKQLQKSKKHKLNKLQMEFTHIKLPILRCVISTANELLFDFVVDGKQCGPFAQIVVQPLFEPTQKHSLTLPLMHYLPLRF